MKTENEVAAIIVDAALTVHRQLGPGLFESAYEVCLVHELRSRGVIVEVQKELPVSYKEVRLEAGYRIDLMVEGIVIVELKSVRELSELHFAQIMTYLKLSNTKLGLLINFNVKFIKDGIKRVANGM
jgi:GxxExxY protein